MTGPCSTIHEKWQPVGSLLVLTNKIKVQVSSLSKFILNAGYKTFQQSVIWPNFGTLFDALVQKYAGVSATNLQPWCFKGQLWIIIFFILLKTWCLEQRLLYSYLFNVIVKCTHHIFPIWQIRAHCSSLHRDSPYLMAAFIYHKTVYTKYSIHWSYVLIHCIKSGLWSVKSKIMNKLTDYKHKIATSLTLCCPNSYPQSQIDMYSFKMS